MSKPVILYIHAAQEQVDLLRAKLAILRAGPAHHPGQSQDELAASLATGVRQLEATLREAEAAITTAAVAAMERAHGFVDSLTPGPVFRGECSGPPTTKRVPVEPFVVTTADVLAGSLADLIEASR